MLGGAVVLGAVIRIAYLVTDDRVMIGGDGFAFHAEALRFADGLPYTSALGDIGAPSAGHPPGWVTLLGVVSWLGGRSLRTHQIVGIVIGLAVIAVAGLIGRRYFNARVGVVAALIAALYPGFWVLEGNVLSEPLGLLLLGLFMLVVIDLHDKPTLLRSVGAGAVCGLVTLVRSEELALLAIVVAPVLLRARALPLRQRVMWLAAATVAGIAVVVPWTLYNATRFEEPVVLSTNTGGLLLVANCPPATYSGDLLGYYDRSCRFRLSAQHPGFDESQLDGPNRAAALENITDNLDKLPVVVPARFGRMLAVFRPSQTVGFVATWMTTDSWPIWAWIASFWLLIPLAVLGGVRAYRAGRFLIPLVGPLIIVIVTVGFFYGEPRYHSPADLGVVVLAAAGVDALLARSGRSARVPAPTGPT